ncbi:hypothetical protein [Psychroflexus sp. ALD_RP9]|uniref:hypothetical protein n=1 Tax=Psychroflexus sp. ALD_RP9 TaxID=2777186 RepID=UPI001A8C1E78|nr:hypothetical protein [Psychroflexus sp. ALD_RP9]QSS96646.1 hypothetical protein IMZ30_09355 [Psychroflexus sp. ALD_RP9]
MKKIDDIISVQLELIRKKITKENFELLCEFDLNELDELKEKSEKLKKIKGIYLFEIYNMNSIIFDEWIKDFTLKFRGIENKYLQKWTPNIVNLRTEKHLGKKAEWIPLYIGKSKNIANRIDKHINSTLGKPPSALKLMERGNLNNHKFRIKYIDFNYIKNYEAIVGEIEKKLRNEINPIAGK